ncbi:MAG TPA: NAD-dependent epimerase/dehydratase family protein [Arenimonas sp.]|uniref:NAD-dependent epimerase/dehydratase family protein n=1 Tax=Arenimonas sp. TaxID=1872635 RepID=UPI002BFC6731|nr:NAD-dependent epimerase/dehydratase family protein [Arenimonas sp.]HMB57016.1 NAD-dependent epimerase/dehydratase family protein [Arenimonas sp.]
MALSSACLVIAGAGDVGGRLAALRAARGEDVIALRRRDVAATAPGIRNLRADLASGEGLSRLPRQPDALVFCAAPEQRDEAAYRRLYVDGLRRLLDVVDTPRLIFVSSTSVYAEDAGEWVDETTTALPRAFNGRALLDAEQILSLHPGGVALRLSGIYGPDREALLRRARAGEADRQHWSNRIHVEDAVAALSHLLDLVAPQRLYLGSDDAPALEADLQHWVREQEGLSPVSTLSAGDGQTGRRIANARLRASGWAPAYPDYRAGYAKLLTNAPI